MQNKLFYENCVITLVNIFILVEQRVTQEIYVKIYKSGPGYLYER